MCSPSFLHLSTLFWSLSLSMWCIISHPLQNLNYLCKDSESIEILGKIQDQVDILQQSTERVSSSAEVCKSYALSTVYGCFPILPDILYIIILTSYLTSEIEAFGRHCWFCYRYLEQYSRRAECQKQLRWC
jgi:hypothetical protein